MEGPVASTWMHHADSDVEPGLRVDFVPAPRSTRNSTRRTGPGWRDLRLLCVLVLLAASVRVWIIFHTEVAARDSIGFIRYALQLEQLPWTQVLRESQQHPGYPITMLAVSWPVRALAGGTTPTSMQLSAQIASALAGILLVLPMYFLGRDLLNPSVGFWGTALFQCLPVSARALSDGLSEATFLLFVALALLATVRGLRRGSVGCFALAGFFGGLAYLTRPEGALVVIAAAIVLLLIPLVGCWPRAWRRALACQAALLSTGLAAGLPYILITGTFTNKPTPRAMFGAAWLDLLRSPPVQGTGEQKQSQGQLPPNPVAVDRQPPGITKGPVLAVYCPEELTDRRFWALKAIGVEVARSLQYVLVAPLLLGLWWFRKVFRSKPEIWVLIILCILHTAVLWRLANVVGYVSDRHVLVLVLCGIFTAAAAVIVFGNWVMYGRSLPWNLLKNPVSGPAPCWLALSLLLAFAGLGLAEALKPLHGNRVGHRAAGLWLAEHTHPADPVVDPYCWAHYYAGRVFQEGIRPPVPAGYDPTAYVVLEPGHDHFRLPAIKEAQELSARGTVVYRWPENHSPADAKIFIYAVK
jgi:Dolichyl-phosphate-mannose-protein mannosyltransferase